MSEQLVVSQIFVYGTLMSKFDNPMAYVLESNCQLVGKGMFSGQMFDANDFPAAVYDENAESFVKGEIFSIQPEQFQRLVKILDRYEGFVEGKQEESLFMRSVVSVLSEDGHSVPCWTYLYNQSTSEMEMVSSGDWIQFLKDQGKNI